jgi:PTS system nitrogen regulatory IIA component
MRLAALVKPELIFADLPGSDRATVLRALSERLATASLVEDADELYHRLCEREELGSTGVGAGVAIPHCKLNGLQKGVLAVGLCPAGVDFGASDGEAVKLFFLLVSPGNSAAVHLQSLAAISKWVKDQSQVEKLLRLDNPQAIYELLLEESG